VISPLFILLPILLVNTFSYGIDIHQIVRSTDAETEKQYQKKYGKNYRSPKLGQSSFLASEISEDMEKPSEDEFFNTPAVNPLPEQPLASSRSLTRRSTTGSRLKFPINKTLLFSIRNCGIVLKDSAFTSCYSKSSKISTVIHYTLRGNDLRSKYIEERPKFYPDTRVPKAFRSEVFTFNGGKYDRGHIRSHASTAYNQLLLEKTYSLVNIWPQNPILNQEIWIKAEKYERIVAKKLGQVEVYNFADTQDSSTRIGREKVLVPVGFYKLIINISKGFRECFYYKNIASNPVLDRLENHSINCEKVFY